MKVQYGDACLSLEQVYEWARKFMNGTSSVTDSPRPGQAHNHLRKGYADSLLGRTRGNLGALHAQGNTVNSATYADLLKHHLRPAKIPNDADF